MDAQFCIDCLRDALMHASIAERAEMQNNS